jgi:hypothetical protein
MGGLLSLRLLSVTKAILPLCRIYPTNI